MPDNMDSRKAEEALKKDFGSEGYKILIEGVDAIIDVTKSFNGSYSDFQNTVKDYYQRGMIKDSNGVIRGMDRKSDNRENF